MTAGSNLANCVERRKNRPGMLPMRAKRDVGPTRALIAVPTLLMLTACAPSAADALTPEERALVLSLSPVKVAAPSERTRYPAIVWRSISAGICSSTFAYRAMGIDRARVVTFRRRGGLTAVPWPSRRECCGILLPFGM